MKKGAALLIVVLFIAIFGAVTVTMTRAGLLNSIFTNNTIDAIVAEEASQAGLEVGLLHYKIYGPETSWSRFGCPLNSSTMCVDVDNAGEPDCKACFGKSAKDRYADIIFSKDSNDLITITSTGHYGYVVKQHVLTQEAKPW